MIGVFLREILYSVRNQYQVPYTYCKGRLIYLQVKKKADGWKTFINENVKNHIAEVCQRHNYTIAIRETGEHSIARIESGAHPKPHWLLEKSLKEGKLEASLYNKLKGDNSNLLGLVGKWVGSEVVGLYVDKEYSEKDSSSTIIFSENSITKYYVDFGKLLGKAENSVSLAVGNYKEIGEKLKLDDNNLVHFYTGDYDLHEAYQDLKQIPEATPEKIKLLASLNGISEDLCDLTRPEFVESSSAGKNIYCKYVTEKEYEAKKAKILQELRPDAKNSLVVNALNAAKWISNKYYIVVDLPYGLFQHGDQATYKFSTFMSVEELVESVMQETKEPLLWCDKGVWYRTENNAEHAALRKQLGVTPPSTWIEKK